MIGIEFIYKTTYQKVVYELLKGINFDDYNYHIVENEIIVETKDNMRLPSNIIGKCFLNYFNKEDYFINFLNLQIYKKNVEPKTIKTYDDFLSSNCEMILLITDNKFIEFYFKDEKLRNIILENLGSLDIKYDIKTKETDGRNIMYLNKSV